MMDDALLKRLDKIIMLEKDIKNDLREIKESLDIKPKTEEPMMRFRNYENYKYNNQEEGNEKD